MFYDLYGWGGHSGIDSVNLDECRSFQQIGNKIRFKFSGGDTEDVFFEDEEVVYYVLKDMRKQMRIHKTAMENPREITINRGSGYPDYIHVVHHEPPQTIY